MKKVVLYIVCCLFHLSYGATYYVNDGSTVGDIYCTGTGSPAGPGTPANPYSSLKALLESGTVVPGDIIYVDAGTYNDEDIFKSAPCVSDITIIGAGAIGIEFAYFFNAYGTEVTVVEMMDTILPIEDHEVSATLEKSLTSQGIRVLTGTKTAAADTSGDGVKLTVEPAEGGDSQTIESEVCLVAIGIAPVLPNNAEQIKLDDRGFIAADERYMTNVPNVFAAGDITGPPWLAHTGSYEAVQAIEGIFVDGHEPKQVGAFPACTYCHPEVASIGLTEEACKEQGLDYRVGKFPFAASGRALAVAESEGFVKIIFDKKHGEILGAHMIGGGSTELIAEIALAMNLEATHEEIEATIHAHPTLAEAVHEATSDAFGHAIHI
jgi:dihydrolipoamide dehydrogenase